MKKIVTILGAVLLTASTVQIASAGQRDKVRKFDRTQTQNQQFRDSNAYYAPNSARDWRDEDYGYGYNNRLEALARGGAVSAPAGR